MQDSILVSIEIGERTKYRMMYLFGLSLLAIAFIFNSISEIFNGIFTIITSESILLTDYMALSNVGAAFLNSGLLVISFTYIGRRSKALMNGPLIASLFLVAGFALFGKNIYNVWSIVIGVYIHSLIQKDHFTKYIIIAFFGTALSPIVSLLSFGLNIQPFLGILIGNFAGLVIGLILPPLASSYVRFHQGFNLYNIGFTSGVIGMLFMSLFRLYGVDNEALSIIYEKSDFVLILYLLFIFSSMIGLFFIYSNRKLIVYKNILKQPGRLVTDFVTIEGFAFTVLNMGLLGFMTLAYVILVGGHLSGPVIGGIFTVVGFGSFGKHPKNTLPIIIGVVLATLVSRGDLSSTGAILTALFATTLAPITGYYGVLAGILGGFLHMSLVSNLAYLHGGMNLYNNGFAGGFVAAILIPIFESYKKTSY